MKFTPEVVAALEVLRAAAENDFERHRLDVLERDLTAPPKVEVVDDNHQKFCDVVFVKRADHKNCDAGHYYRQTGIHRDVWQYYHGEIPKGYVIHHVDENPANNNIENLQCLSAEDHGQTHLSKGEQIPKQRKTFTCVVCGRKFEGYNNGQTRYCSEECRNFKRYHETKKAEITCEWCGKKFFGKKTSRFCSGHCATTARYAKLRQKN